MQSGLKQGASGPDVEQLHHILQAAGLVIDPKDLGGSAFGPSTVAALKALQVQHGLPASGEVDEGTLNVLLAVEKATKDTHAGAAPAHIPSPAIVVIQKGSVHGKVVDEDGNGLTATITLFSQGLRDRTALANTKTDAQGQYSLRLGSNQGNSSS